LVDLEIYKQDRRTYYVSVYNSGKQGYQLWRQQGWANFNKKKEELNQKGYRLIDLEYY